MKRSTLNKLLASTLLAVLAGSYSASAISAGYIKFDGVDGESRRQAAQPEKPASRVSAGGNQKPAGLLLPAVQKAQVAEQKGKKPTKDQHRSGDEHEIEYDVVAGH